MVGVVKRSDRMRNRMDRAKSFLESGRAHRGGREHIGPRFKVGAVRDGARQIGLDDPHAFERDAVGERMKRVDAIGLKAMGERVHAGRHGQERRQPDAEFGIFDRHFRHHGGMEDDLLLVRRLIGDDAGATDLRAGASRRRHGDDRRDPVRIGAGPPVADILEIPDRPRLRRHEGDAFADIERGAAADRDDSVMAPIPKNLDPGKKIGLGRVAADLSEKSGRHAAVRQDPHDAGNKRQIDQPLSVTTSGLTMPWARARSASSAMRPTPVTTRVGEIPSALQMIHHQYNLRLLCADGMIWGGSSLRTRSATWRRRVPCP